VDASFDTPPVRLGRPMNWWCQPKGSYGGTREWEDIYGPQGWCMAEEPNIECECNVPGERPAGAAWAGRRPGALAAKHAGRAANLVRQAAKHAGRAARQPSMGPRVHKGCAKSRATAAGSSRHVSIYKVVLQAGWGAPARSQSSSSA
jgi:hypothetical protein